VLVAVVARGRQGGGGDPLEDLLVDRVVAVLRLQVAQDLHLVGEGAQDLPLDLGRLLVRLGQGKFVGELEVELD
jgi:hypothetical protein